MRYFVEFETNDKSRYTSKNDSEWNRTGDSRSNEIKDVFTKY